MNPSEKEINPKLRIQTWFAFLVFIMSIFVVRLFYVQIIKHDYYQKAALSDQLKQYELPANRGIIVAHSSGVLVPLVLNETLFTVYADPKFIVDKAQTSIKVSDVIGGKTEDLKKMMEMDTRYSVLAKKVSKQQKQKLEGLKLKGIGFRETVQRTYPQGQLASQLLGFVNDDGIGKYGIEQALNETLTGKPGKLKAITDAQGVPLASNQDNILISPKNGSQLALTIDLGMQQQLEDILKQGLEAASSKSGGAVIIDPYSGAIKAMANYPTYNPSDFSKVTDLSVFSNAIVSSPMEIGSTMKPLTLAAALDQGVVNKDTTYFDPSVWVIGDSKVVNVEEDGGAATRSMKDILQLSLNTGATWLIMQMGGGEINEKARIAWHNYLVDHYQYGKETGIEQGYEAPGSVPSPTDGYGLNIKYANTGFGQGITATPLQLGLAISSVINGGVYYRPYLIEKYTEPNGLNKDTKPVVVRNNVVKKEVSDTIREYMIETYTKNFRAYNSQSSNVPRPEFSIGGKTGTAQEANPDGGYYSNIFNGTYVGFVGGDMPQYVISIRVNDPKIPGYAGAKAAAPIFLKLTNMLIDSYGVTPKMH